MFINVRGCIMFVLPVLFWPCPSPQVEIRQTEVKHQLDVSSNQFPYIFHKKLFCHAASRVRMGGSSGIFLQKSVHSQTFKRQWTSYSHLSKHSFLLPYTFWEDSTVMSFVCCFLWMPLREAWHWMLFSQSTKRFLTSCISSSGQRKSPGWV